MKITIYTLAVDSPDNGTECEVFETREMLAGAITALVRKSHPSLADTLDSVDYESDEWDDAMEEYDEHRDPLITYVEGTRELDLLTILNGVSGVVRTAEQGVTQEAQCRRLLETVMTPRPGETWFYSDTGSDNVWNECRIEGPWNDGSPGLAFHVKDLSGGAMMDRVVYRTNLRWKTQLTGGKA